MERQHGCNQDLWWHGLTHAPRALDAVARMDATAAVQIVLDDDAIDAEFRAFVVKLVASMKEDLRTIQTGLLPVHRKVH